jgi:hypothetical protein
MIGMEKLLGGHPDKPPAVIPFHELSAEALKGLGIEK